MALSSRPATSRVAKTLAGVLGTVLLGMLAVVLVVRSSRDPTLADVPPVHAPTQPARGDGRTWEALQRALTGMPTPAVPLGDALEGLAAPHESSVQAARPLESTVRALGRALLRTEGLLVPLPPTPDDPGPELLPYLDAARAWLLLAWHEAGTGSPEGPRAALSAMLHTHALGLRFVEGDSGLVGVMVGLAIERTARRELLELLALHGDADATLYEAASALRAVEPGAVARALAVEARWLEAMYAQGALQLSWLEAATYDEQTTRAWFRQEMQATVDRAALPLRERPPQTPPPWSHATSWTERLHNRTGRVLLDLGQPDYERAIAREDAAVASSRLAVLLIAARRYAHAHAGQLPPDQDALVPAFLPAPLQDPFDGQPLRLAGPDAWSVGEGAAEGPDALRLPLRVE